MFDTGPVIDLRRRRADDRSGSHHHGRRVHRGVVDVLRCDLNYRFDDAPPTLPLD